jgi:hypothetical protein
MEYGQYEECQELSPLFNYNFLQIKITNGTPIPIAYMGLCLPSECQPAQIISYTNQVFQNMSVSATVSDIHFAMKNSEASFGFAFYFMTLLTAFLFGLVVYASYMKYR